MAQPYVGEIRIFAGNFAPAGWEFCHGQTLSIMENEVLFQLIGTTYGGDGETGFSLPDLRGRSPLHFGAGQRGTYILAESGGTEVEHLTVQQIPSHSHPPLASTDAATSANPASGVWAPYGDLPYGSGAPGTGLHPETVMPTGDSQPHENMPPFLALNFIISLFGIFPSQT